MDSRDGHEVTALTMAQRLGVSERSVRRHLAPLPRGDVMTPHTWSGPDG